MIITLACTNDKTYSEDYNAANREGTLILFTIDVASVATITKLKGTDFRWNQLDGGLRTLQTPYRIKSSFTTKPDLVLNGISTSFGTGGTLRLNGPNTYEQLLGTWVFSLSKWIATRALYTTANDGLNLVKVELSNADFTPDMLQGSLFAQSVTLEFESTLPYGVGQTIQLAQSGAIGT